MHQHDLNCEVARLTGESIRTIKRLGFLVSDPRTQFDDPDDEALGGLVIDWDEEQAYACAQDLCAQDAAEPILL